MQVSESYLRQPIESSVNYSIWTIRGRDWQELCRIEAALARGLRQIISREFELLMAATTVYLNHLNYAFDVCFHVFHRLSQHYSQWIFIKRLSCS